MTDPIADMIIRIKNAYLARQNRVEIPHSKLKESIAQILVTEKYVDQVEIQDTKPQKTIILTLRYVGKTPAITNVKRISKPGRRIYSPVDEIPRALGGYGIVIVSTNKGILTGQQAKQQGVGGEVLCSIW